MRHAQILCHPETFDLNSVKIIVDYVELIRLRAVLPI
jgi:hypothetical protein